MAEKLLGFYLGFGSGFHGSPSQLELSRRSRLDQRMGDEIGRLIFRCGRPLAEVCVLDRTFSCQGVSGRGTNYLPPFCLAVCLNDGVLRHGARSGLSPRSQAKSVLAFSRRLVWHRATPRVPLARRTARRARATRAVAPEFAFQAPAVSRSFTIAASTPTAARGAAGR